MQGPEGHDSNRGGAVGVGDETGGTDGGRVNLGDDEGDVMVVPVGNTVKIRRVKRTRGKNGEFIFLVLPHACASSLLPSLPPSLSPSLSPSTYRNAEELSIT